MSDLTVNSWHRKGRHRLYLNRADRTTIGYWDLAANEPHPNHPGDLDTLVRHVRQWTAEHPDEAAWWMSPADASAPSGPGVADVASNGSRRDRGTPEPATQHETWTDLAGNPAGAEARKRARDLRGDSWVRAVWHRVRGTDKAERTWRIGADGEAKVGAVLERVAARDGRWQPPIHSVPVGSRAADIDHVLIGSGGVFTVNVKHHPHGDVSADRDEVRVNGYDWHYVDKSRHEASRASKLLSTACGFAVHAEALIVIVGAKHVRIARPADGVHLIEVSGLASWLRTRRDLYSDGIAQAIHDAARRSTVWRPPVVK